MKKLTSEQEDSVAALTINYHEYKVGSISLYGWWATGQIIEEARKQGWEPYMAHGSFAFYKFNNETQGATKHYQFKKRKIQEAVVLALHELIERKLFA